MGEGETLGLYGSYVCRCGLIIRVASSDRTPAATDRMAADETETEMEYINMAVDNSMLDDYSLYVYLADSDAE